MSAARGRFDIRTIFDRPGQRHLRRSLADAWLAPGWFPATFSPAQRGTLEKHRKRQLPDENESRRKQGDNLSWW
ncbi:MAG: hypothetical protein U1G07_03775 [Verrucomicrobiota bacterium]